MDDDSTINKTPHGSDDIDRLAAEHIQDRDDREVLEDAEARRALIEFLANLRRDCGWTQSDLAKKLKTTQSAVSDFEKGVNEPRLTTLQRWARAYGYRLELQLWEGNLQPADSQSLQRDRRL